MGNAGTGKHRKQSRVMTRPVRVHVAAGSAVTCAGILAFTLVTPPPNSSRAPIDVRPVHLSAFALPESPAACVKFVEHRATAGLTLTSGAGAYVSATDWTTPYTLFST